MRLSRYTDYALRSLQMAAFRHPKLTRADDVVKAHNLSLPHVGKIVFQLGKAGYFQTVRGRSGGFRLKRPAETIIIGDVVRLTEGTMGMVECFDPQTNTCPLIDVCLLSVAFKRASSAYMDVLDQITLADIVANKDELVMRMDPAMQQRFAKPRPAGRLEGELG